MQNLNSIFLQKFAERGFLAQATDIEQIDKLENITAYIGFDCTAKSLHIGSLMQIMILRMLLKQGHNAIILLGGGTTKIGDPSGKDDVRQILTESQIADNLAGIKKTLEKFIKINDKAEFTNLELTSPQRIIKGDGGQAIIVNNDEWLSGLKYIDFLRDVGRHFSVNRMLSFDSVKLRLDRDQPLSFIEFNYMILQAYDFYHLNKKYGCNLQIGGSDQWGNIINGVELIRKINVDKVKNDNQSNNAFGLTSPLLTNSEGKKMGKTANGAVWLDADMFGAFDYFQYFRNVNDADVIKFIKLFTNYDIEINEKVHKITGHNLQNIGNLILADAQIINQLKELLAFEVTKICHNEEVANNCLATAREIFVNKNSQAFIEKEIIFEQDSKKLFEIIKEIGASESNSEAKKLILNNAVKINSQLITDINYHFDKNTYQNQKIDLSIGKKKFYQILFK